WREAYLQPAASVAESSRRLPYMRPSRCSTIQDVSSKSPQEFWTDSIAWDRNPSPMKFKRDKRSVSEQAKSGLKIAGAIMVTVLTIALFAKGYKLQAHPDNS